jgi:hypothetical protein
VAIKKYIKGNQASSNRKTRREGKIVKKGKVYKRTGPAVAKNKYEPGK